MPPEKEALVCDVQRFSVHDGPGIRTTVFFKGCPLACRWCQNPETIAFDNEPVYTAGECLLCGDCAEACPESAIEVREGSLCFDRAKCKACFECVEACPGGALSPAARTYNADALLAEVLRDADYYGKEGGITLSGGEPLVHGTFLAEFLPRARREGLHVVVETAGCIPARRFEALADLVDLFFYDLKVIDEARHRELTGRSNGLILENLRRLAEEGRRVQVRMPVIPGRNDDAENLERTARLVASLGLSSIVLLPYHRLGEGKLAKVKAPYQPIESRPPTNEEMAAAADFFRSHGIEPGGA